MNIYLVLSAFTSVLTTALATKTMLYFFSFQHVCLLSFILDIFLPKKERDKQTEIRLYAVLKMCSVRSRCDWNSDAIKF